MRHWFGTYEKSYESHTCQYRDKQAEPTRLQLTTSLNFSAVLLSSTVVTIFFFFFSDKSNPPPRLSVAKFDKSSFVKCLNIFFWWHFFLNFLLPLFLRDCNNNKKWVQTMKLYLWSYQHLLHGRNWFVSSTNFFGLIK